MGNKHFKNHTFVICAYKENPVLRRVYTVINESANKK